MNDHILINYNTNRHPLSWVKGLINFYIGSGYVSQNTFLTLSVYSHIPQSFSDNRRLVSLPFSQLNEGHIFNIISSLQEGEELAFHSKIHDFGLEYHIPLIDFGNVDRGIIDQEPLRELSHKWGMNFNIYNSGRSFHAYGNKLINSNEWIQFMGSLLLLNIPSGFKLIDERWVGHRIMAGYSALRWSNNSSRYKKTPTYIGYFNQEGFFEQKQYIHSSFHNDFIG
ncbi:hypothetical protein [Pectobacterium sp. CHL-2024]|uniref:primase 1D-like protein n=1 Tax=Pectobacterium sp. CHL-2024 TaxID=3377079 RepID=UPI00380A0AAD